ncbi:MAG: PA14 domain-containing protein [Planctomycetota bacterium]
MRYLLAVVVLFSGITLSQAFAADELEPGLKAEFFDMGDALEDFPDVKDKKPAVTRVDKTINVESTEDKWPGTNLEHHFYIRWTGVIKIEKDGKYKFYTQSDDGSRLYIDNKQVVDNGGLHGMDEKDGEAELKAGNHDIKVDFFENEGGHGCIVSWEPAGGAKEVIPEKVLFHKK